MRKRYKFFEIKKINNYLRRKIFFKNVYINYLLKNTYLPYYLRQIVILFLWKNNKFINLNKLNCICLETGKTKSIVINFKVSRLILKFLISKMVINGVYKYSW